MPLKLSWLERMAVNEKAGSSTLLEELREQEFPPLSQINRCGVHSHVTAPWRGQINSKRKAQTESISYRRTKSFELNPVLLATPTQADSIVYTEDATLVAVPCRSATGIKSYL